MSVWKAHGQDVTDSLAVLPFWLLLYTVCASDSDGGYCPCCLPCPTALVCASCPKAMCNGRRSRFGMQPEMPDQWYRHAGDMPCNWTPYQSLQISVSPQGAGCPLDHRPTVLDLEVQSPKSPNGLSKNASFYIVSACFRITHSWTLDLFI